MKTTHDVYSVTLGRFRLLGARRRGQELLAYCYYVSPHSVHFDQSPPSLPKCRSSAPLLCPPTLVPPPPSAAEDEAGLPPADLLAGDAASRSGPPGMMFGTFYRILEALAGFSALATIDYFYWGLGMLCIVSQGFFPSVAGFEFMAEIRLKWDCGLFFFFHLRQECRWAVLLILLLPPGRNLSFHS